MLRLEDLITVLNEIDGIGPNIALSLEGALEDQGIDSLSLFNLLLKLEERSGVSVPEEAVDSMRTAQDIINFFNNRLAQ